MKLTRTANAGVLLELDGVSILLDGVCREVKPYPATPPEVRQRLMENFPDMVAFTHAHKDHYDPAYAAEYIRQTGRVIFAPEGIRGGSMEKVMTGGVTVMPVPCRHIGAAGKDTPHTGFVITGSKCVWFTGDSSPTAWKGREDLPKPDVLIVPYAYCNTPTSWAFTKSLNAQVVLLHMPNRKEDTIGLWSSVEAATGTDPIPSAPSMGESVYVD